MDWRSVRICTLCLLVFSPLILGKPGPGDNIKDDLKESPKEVPELSESEVIYVKKEGSQIKPFQINHSNVSNKTLPAEENTPSQIEAPVKIKKFRRRLKTFRRDGKSSRIVTSDERNKRLPAQSSVSVSPLLTPDPSILEESSRVEDIGDSTDNLKESSSYSKNNARSNEENSKSAHFVPSENFPRNLVHQSRKDSVNRRAPSRNESGKLRYAANIDLDSPGKTSRSDTSGRRFDSKRKNNPSNFNGQQFRDNRNPLQQGLKEEHQSNSFPQDARKVTIVKEKAFHSTSSEAAKERVNIEKSPTFDPPVNKIAIHRQPATSHIPQNFNNIVNQKLFGQPEHIILTQGTHISGKNYGPEDDTFGYYTNFYNDDKPVTHSPNGRNVNVVKMIKTQDSVQPTNSPFNNHGDGQSWQYFVSTQPNSNTNIRGDQTLLDNQFVNKEQRKIFENTPKIRPSGQNQFQSSQINVDSRHIPHAPIPQNTPIHQTQLHTSNNADHSKFADGQPISLNTNPDPNELYIDENTGQLIKFVIREDPHKVPDHVAGRNFHNQESPNIVFSQRLPEPQEHIDVLHQKGTSQGQLSSEISLGGPNLRSHSSSNDFKNQANTPDSIQHEKISDADAIHITIPRDGNSQEIQQVYFIPQDEAVGQQYNQGPLNSKENSAEYVVLCDQGAQDYSSEHQSGYGKQNFNPVGNTYQQTNYPTQNQYQNKNQGASHGINQNKGHSYKSDNQELHLGYGTNSANHEQNSGYQSTKEGNNYFSGIPQTNTNTQGHYKGSEYPDNEGVTNFAIPQNNKGNQNPYKGSEFNDGVKYDTPPVSQETQGEYKGSEYSNNNGGENFAIMQVQTGSQGHYKGSQYSDNKGATNLAPFDSGTQSNYKGPQTSNNQGIKNFVFPQTNIPDQGHNKGSEFSNNKGVTNIAIPQNDIQNQGHYKGSEYVNNEGAVNFANSNIKAPAQGHFKGSDLSNNKGQVNLAVPQIQAQSFNKGGTNYATPQTNIGSQGFSKGATNYATPQANIGSQAHYKGSKFPNNQGQTDGLYKGSDYTSNKGSENQHIGTELPNNKGNTKYIILQINTQGQGNYDGSNLNDNKGVTNFAIPQENREAQGQYKGTQFPRNIESGKFPAPQTSVNAQGQYKGFDFSNAKQNTKAPTYKENVSPQYPSTKGNNKGTTYPETQNQGSYGQGLSGTFSSNYDTGSGHSNKDGYQINNNAFSNNEGYERGSSGFPVIDNKKGSEYPNQQGPVGHNVPSNNPEYSNTANEFPSVVRNNPNYNAGQNVFPVRNQNQVPLNINKKRYSTGTDLLTSIITSQNIGGKSNYNSGNAGFVKQGRSIGAPVEDPRLSTQKGYNTGAISANNYPLGRNTANSEGYAANTDGVLGTQSNLGGKTREQNMPFVQHGINAGTGNQNNFAKANNLFSGGIPTNLNSNKQQPPSQKEYLTNNEAPRNHQLPNLRENAGDLALLIQKGFNAESDVFPPNKIQELFSSKVPNRGFEYPSQRSHVSNSNTGPIGKQILNIGNVAELLSGPITSKLFNADLNINRGKGLNNKISENEGYKTTPNSVSFSGTYSLPDNTQGYGAPQGNSNFEKNTNVRNQAFVERVNAFPNDQVYQRARNPLPEDFKGKPIRIPLNNGHDNPIGLFTAKSAHEGNSFQQNRGNTEYGPQQAPTYEGKSYGSGVRGQQYSVGSDKHSTSYSSKEENADKINQKYDDEPVQLLLVEENLPAHENGNKGAMYYIQHKGNDQSNKGSSQEQSYLILDESDLKQHPKLRVMVDGGKDRTYPIRQLATAGMHVARSVIPQIQNSRGRSIEGNINFGLQIKKGVDPSSNSEQYLQSRSDEEIDEKPVTIPKDEAENNKQEKENKAEEISIL